MGRSRGILWAERGHEVFFAERDAEKAQAVAELTGKIGRAAEFGEVLVYTARGVASSSLLRDPAVLAGKIAPE